MAKATKKTEEPTSDIESVREAAQTYLVSQLAPKTFSSGKIGFFAQGKVVIGEDRFQAQIQLVKIEPKK